MLNSLYTFNSHNHVVERIAAKNASGPVCRANWINAQDPMAWCL